MLILQPLASSLQERGARALFALICGNQQFFQAKVSALYQGVVVLQVVNHQQGAGLTLSARL